MDIHTPHTHTHSHTHAQRVNPNCRRTCLRYVTGACVCTHTIHTHAHIHTHTHARTHVSHTHKGLKWVYKYTPRTHADSHTHPPRVNPNARTHVSHTRTHTYTHAHARTWPLSPQGFMWDLGSAFQTRTSVGTPRVMTCTHIHPTPRLPHRGGRTLCETGLRLVSRSVDPQALVERNKKLRRRDACTRVYFGFFGTTFNAQWDNISLI